MLLLTFTLRLPAFFVDVFNSDETFLATQAQVIRDGGSLYQEATDRKPPLVPYLYAATFAVVGSSALWSIRVAAMLAVALTALLLASEARRRWGDRAAWTAALLFVGASVAFAPQDGQAANFEVFMLPAMTAAVVLAARDRPRGAGFAVAIATLAKQTGAATLLPVAYLLWKRRPPGGVRRGLLAFALPLFLVALLVGPGDLVFWAVAGNGSYFGLGSVSAYVAGLFAVMTFAFVACNLPVLWTVPEAWRERQSGVDTDLWIWLFSGAISVAVGFRFFGHYYLQLLPPLCLISAGALAKRPAIWAQRTIAVSLVTACGFTAVGFLFQPWGDEPKYERVSSFLEHRLRPTDRVFVWGHLPEIYWASGARPATRFLSSGFYLGDWGGRPPGDERADAPTPGARIMLMDDLRIRAPRYILDTTPAKIRGSQYHPMASLPEFRAYVDRSYHRVRAIDDIVVYERLAPSRLAEGGPHRAAAPIR
ncbi:MAG: glycosyltransferase family 39 protein [Acidimicrobiia bacterium]|nr:glycosyltransferase family 39 protein [Acidimicrobiia bacterium]